MINGSLDTMTKTEARVGMYCLSNTGDFAFGTIHTVAKNIGTSTTSVIRFCKRLGFAGFGDFQDAVRLGFKYQPSLPDKLRRTADADTDNIPGTTAHRNIICIEKTFSELPYERFLAAVSKIAAAERVFTFGMRESFALAHYAYTRLMSVRNNVSILNAGYNGEIESVLNFGDKDVCVFFLFHRYTKQAVNILSMLKKQGVSVILVTSAPFDEVAGKAEILLPCYVDSGSIKNTAVAPISLADSLCSAVASKNIDAALSHMKRSETLFRDGDILD